MTAPLLLVLLETFPCVTGCSIISYPVLFLKHVLYCSICLSAPFWLVLYSKLLKNNLFFWRISRNHIANCCMCGWGEKFGQLDLSHLEHREKCLKYISSVFIFLLSKDQSIHLMRKTSGWQLIFREIQYFYLQRSGVEFPKRSPDAAPIFTPPVTRPESLPSYLQVGYRMPADSSTRLDEAMSSNGASLRWSDLKKKHYFGGQIAPFVFCATWHVFFFLSI